MTQGAMDEQSQVNDEQGYSGNWHSGLASGLTFVPWMPSAPADVQLLPLWQSADDSDENCSMILEFHTKSCPDFRRGYCSKHGSKGKASQCWNYHFESQCRRCPVDPLSGQILYWDIPCQNRELGFCINEDACPYAHGREEVSYHPAKYKTRLCNGHECRGEDICCFAHSDSELRHWAPPRYSYLALASHAGAPLVGSDKEDARRQKTSSPYANAGIPGPSQKHRFCASFPNIAQCRRGTACAFAHSREEVRTPLLSVEEEEHSPNALTEEFFTLRFKTLWCPIGAQHDWQLCSYAHTYQDVRRTPSIGYGPQPCPYWSKKDTRAAYAQRCPLGLRCPYSHGAKEQLYHPKYFRTVICRDLQVKGCPRQHLCAFYHRKSERRAALEDDADYNKPLKKLALPAEWADSFLNPPFFQETGEVDEVTSKAAPSSLMPHPMTSGGYCWTNHPYGYRPSKTDQGEETPRTQTTVVESDEAADSSMASSGELRSHHASQQAMTYWPAHTPQAAFFGASTGDAITWAEVPFIQQGCGTPCAAVPMFCASSTIPMLWAPAQMESVAISG